VPKPSHRAYTVIKRENKDDFWLNIGVAFPHDDKDGFNLLLQALPLDGKIVLRTYKEDEEEQKPKGKPIQEVGPVACATNSTSRRRSRRSFQPSLCASLAHRCYAKPRRFFSQPLAADGNVALPRMPAVCQYRLSRRKSIRVRRVLWQQVWRRRPARA
jgi:hypothetical protein